MVTPAGIARLWCMAAPRYRRYHDRRALLPARRDLRNHGTPAEAALWTLIKNRQLGGRRFRRQHSVGSYVLDFYCPSERLSLELDGSGHFSESGRETDMARDSWLEARGIRVLRFENRMVFEHPDHVLATIAAHFMARSTTQDVPLE